MLGYLRNLYREHFSDPEVIILTVLLVVATVAVLLLGRMMAPVLASIVIAYLLEGMVGGLERRGIPRAISAFLVMLVFISGLFLVFYALLPLLYGQVMRLVMEEVPEMIARGEEFLTFLTEQAFISEDWIRDLIEKIRGAVEALGDWIFTLLTNMMVIVVYLVLVPFLVFFFLKDKKLILDWLTSYLPRNRSLAAEVWIETNRQISNFIQGKFWEILIVGGVTMGAFLFLKLEYAILLGVFVGMSVLIPYIGATVMTVPVAIVAYFQWGWGSEMVYVLIVYAIIQGLDANVLFPLLFSKVVNLHPVAIIVALLFFGSVWGFWGMFFAIPLATLVKAVLSAWPRVGSHVEGENDDFSPG